MVQSKRNTQVEYFTPSGADLRHELRRLGLSEETAEKLMTTATREELRREALAKKPDHYVRLKDAAATYGVREQTISVWIVRGKVHATKITGKETWVDPTDVQRCVEKSKSEPENSQ